MHICIYVITNAEKKRERESERARERERESESERERESESEREREREIAYTYIYICIYVYIFIYRYLFGCLYFSLAINISRKIWKKSSFQPGRLLGVVASLAFSKRACTKKDTSQASRIGAYTFGKYMF